MVRVKGYDQRGIIWFTNYSSRKGHKLAGAVADCIGSGYQ
jgi:pyridoxamine 5'-phosphate oxidase